jgi:hypothetical protein
MRALPAGLLLCAGCHAALQPEPADDLAGLRAPLRSGSSVRLLIDGSVDSHPAEVLLDLASPLTTVSLGCFDEPPDSGGSVKFRSATGAAVELPEIVLRVARVGELRLGTRRVGLETSERRCELALGMDVLSNYAIEVDPARREVRIVRPQEKAAYLAEISGSKAPSEEIHLVELSRDPTADWPLLTAKLEQGRAALIGPFVLSTREPHSLVADAAARRAGLTPGPDMLKELGLSGRVPIPPSLSAPGYPLDQLELSPGFGLKFDAVASDGKWSNASAVGILGSDVWGRFYATIDPRAGVLMLRRPRVFASGERQQCATANGPSEEACFQLTSSQAAGKPVDVVGVVWRDLPEGARVYLEPRGADGAPLQLSCRVGFSFEKSDRGASAEHYLPWEGLQKALPQCATELHRVREYTLGLFEEGALNECPGECAFVQELTTGRVTCECAPQLWGGGTEAEQRFLRIYRRLLERVRGTREALPDEPEPSD